jgi:hypothetical protein
LTPSLQAALAASPSLFPLNVDVRADAVQFVNLSEAEYAAASFLDNRLLQPNQRWGMIPWSELQPAAQGLPLRCNFIFHISHSGSTLLSRLLACQPDFFSVREPAILRLFAEGYAPERLPIYLALWSRTFRPQQTSVIKATSFVSSIATELLNLVPHSRAILMFVPLDTFLAALLDGAMSDIDTQATKRLSRIQARGTLLDVSFADLTLGERVAMSWLSEMLTLSEVAQRFPTRTLWINFDSFLGDTERELGLSFKHFGSEPDLSSILNSSVTQRYAKRPDVGYDAHFRAQLLSQARGKFRDEIERGKTWLATHISAFDATALPVD